MTKTPEVSTTTEAPTLAAHSVTEQFHAYMRSRAADTDMSDRGDEIMEEQAARILMAEGVDAILKADMGGTVQCRDVPGTYWDLRGFSVLKSNRQDIENSEGYYVQFDATCIGGDEDVMRRNLLEIGHTYPLQTSAVLLTTKARALENQDAYPIKLALVGSRTSSGNTVLKWGALPKTTIQGTVSD